MLQPNCAEPVGGLAASQEETGGKKFFSLGSGPARALAGKETLFADIGYRDRADTGVLVMEVDRPPPEVIIQDKSDAKYKEHLTVSYSAHGQAKAAAMMPHKILRVTVS